MLFVVSTQELYRTGECCIPLPGGRGQRDIRYPARLAVQRGRERDKRLGFEDGASRV
jgi:hypothetical protein